MSTKREIHHYSVYGYGRPKSVRFNVYRNLRGKLGSVLPKRKNAAPEDELLCKQPAE